MASQSGVLLYYVAILLMYSFAAGQYLTVMLLIGWNIDWISQLVDNNRMMFITFECSIRVVQ